MKEGMELHDPTHLYEGEISPKAERIANILSIAGQPVFIPIPVFILLATKISDPVRCMLVILVSLFFVTVIPTASTYYFSIKLGRKDGDIPDRTLRFKPMMIGVLSYVIGTIALYLMDAPDIIWVLMLCYAIVTLVMTIITLYWKISIHSVGVVGPSMALAVAFWPWGLLYILLLPPIAWSRYVLKRHTPMQIVAGALTGLVITGIMFLLLL